MVVLTSRVYQTSPEGWGRVQKLVEGQTATIVGKRMEKGERIALAQGCIQYSADFESVLFPVQQVNPLCSSHYRTEF